MGEQELKTAAIQKVLGLSRQDALKVLVFIAGLQAGKELQTADETKHYQSAQTG